MAITKLNKRRVTAGIAAATLLTMSLISGTLAKYTSTGNSWDKARVAKWGIEVTTEGDLFGSAYNGVSADAQPNQIGKWVPVDGGDLTVKATGYADKILAPGTKNETGASIGIGGKAEVDAKVTMVESKGYDIYIDAPKAGNEYTRLTKIDVEHGQVVPDVSGSAVWAIPNDKSDPTLYPMKATGKIADIGTYSYYKEETVIGREAFTTTGGDVMTYKPVQYFLNGGSATTLEALFNEADASGVAAKFKNLKDYQAGESVEIEDTKITWEWKFVQTVDNKDTTEGNGDMDAVDTMLGELALGEEGVIYLVSNGTTGSLISVNSEGAIFSDSKQIGSLRTGFSAQISATQID